MFNCLRGCLLAWNQPWEVRKNCAQGSTSLIHDGPEHDCASSALKLKRQSSDAQRQRLVMFTQGSRHGMDRGGVRGAGLSRIAAAKRGSKLASWRRVRQHRQAWRAAQHPFVARAWRCLTKGLRYAVRRIQSWICLAACRFDGWWRRTKQKWTHCWYRLRRKMHVKATLTHWWCLQRSFAARWKPQMIAARCVQSLCRIFVTRSSDDAEKDAATNSTQDDPAKGNHDEVSI